jgi:hypothetical protein
MTLHDWRTIVFPLVHEIPLIVVDTRIPSPAVLEEIRRVIAVTILHKTVFVVRDDGVSSMIETLQLTPERRAEMIIVKESDMIGKLRQMGLDRTRSPWDNPFYYLTSSRRIEARMREVGSEVDLFRKVLGQTAMSIWGSAVYCDAEQLLIKLMGRPGMITATEQVFADLEYDMAATESFIDSWATSNDDEAHRLVARAQRICTALGKLQCESDWAPPNFLNLTRRLTAGEPEEETVTN